MPAKIDYATLDLMDALDLAILIEAEAYERYIEFAQQLGHGFDGDAASVFRGMAVNEGKHASELAKRREALFGEAPMRVKKSAVFDVEAPDYGAPRWNMSPLKAYELALSSEQKAFAFYNDAMEYVKDADIRALFGELRDEEAEHVQMVTAAIAALPASAACDQEDEDE